MSDELQSEKNGCEALRDARTLADEAFARAAGAPLVFGNSVRLLKDAAENYPAWLEAIGAAKEYVLFESYIIYDDRIGNEFAHALIEAAKRGVRVRVIYDWFGRIGNDLFSGRFWRRIRESGIEVRVYNPPRFDSSLGWIGRDHRKTVAVDGRVGYVSGMCVGDDWMGESKRANEPWRDTGVEIRGPAVADIENAFADIWATMGDAIPECELAMRDSMMEAGDTAVRVVAGVPSNAGLFRLDQIIAAIARRRLWLTDAYFAGTTSYVQALRAAAKSGVDVRLLVPGKTDNPIMTPLSRAGYRPLLEAGIRVFEWNGAMIHAKTAVADSRWGRVGSSNLNAASWFGNYEMDVAVEDERFAREMEEMYLLDLQNATEIVLDAEENVRAPGERKRKTELGHKFGSGGRALAGALRVGGSVGAAVTNRRLLGHAEARLMFGVGALLLGFAALMYFFPRVFLYPFTLFVLWVAVALLIKGFRRHRRRSIRAGEKSVPVISGKAPQSAPPIQTKEDARPNQIGMIKNESDEAVLPDDPTENEAKREANL